MVELCQSRHYCLEGICQEGITEKVISEQRSNVARECATCTPVERALGRGNRWKGPGQDLSWTAPGLSKATGAGEEGTRRQLSGDGDRGVSRVDSIFGRRWGNHEHRNDIIQVFFLK